MKYRLDRWRNGNRLSWCVYKVGDLLPEYFDIRKRKCQAYIRTMTKLNTNSCPTHQNK